MRLNDVARWEQVAKSAAGWDERNALLASFIPSATAIVDLGAGARTLRGYLPDATSYQAVDLVAGPDVIQCDFNAREPPELPQRYDVAVCSGLLEYLVDLERFLSDLPRIASAALLTYAPLLPGQTRAKRAAMGWVSHLTRLELLELLDATGHPWTILRDWRAQTICALYLEEGPTPLLRQREPFESEAAWDAAFALLEQQSSTGDRVAGPASSPAAGIDLAAWADDQRTTRKAGDLERSRQRRLAGLPGWRWASDATAWDDHAARLAAIAPEEHLPDELRAWTSQQRLARKRGELSVAKVATLSAIPGWLWDADLARWIEGLRALRSFVALRGHAAVPATFVQDGFELGAWVAAQRRAHADEALEPARAEVLSEMPGWGWNQADASWSRALLALARFVEREGHASIPPGVVEAGMDLGAWLARQRAAHAARQLDEDRVRRLERFDALTVDPDELVWQEGLLELRRHVADAERAGLAPVEREYPDELAAWVRTQRALHRAQALAPSRAAVLESLDGFALDPHRGLWEHRFAALQRYAQVAGHSSPKRDACANGEPIGRWVAHQRGTHRQGRLDASLAARLDALPGWAWTARQGSFERSFAALAAHASRYGFAIVDPGRPELHEFTLRERRRHAAGELEGVDALRLDGLPGWTWEPLPEWAVPGLQALGSFIAREGRANVPATHVERGFELGAWLHQLAVDHTERALPSEVGRILQEHFRWARRDEHTGWSTSYRGLVARARVRKAGSPPDSSASGSFEG